MTDISIRARQALSNDDQRWIGNGGQPIGAPRSIVLDRSAFDLASTFNAGYIPSGVGVAKSSGTGLYVPYAGNAAEVQTITRTATGGTASFTFDGETTATVVPDGTLTAAAIQTALEGLSNINPGDVTVAGAAGGPFTVTFAGQYLGSNVPQMTTGGSPTGGTVTVATTTAGGPGIADSADDNLGLIFAAVAYDRDSTGDLTAALFWSGEVHTSHLPDHSGVDDAFKAATHHIAYVA